MDQENTTAEEIRLIVRKYQDMWMKSGESKKLRKACVFRQTLDKLSEAITTPNEEGGLIMLDKHVSSIKKLKLSNFMSAGAFVDKDEVKKDIIKVKEWLSSIP